MGKILSSRLKQAKFENTGHEALLNLLVAANYVRRSIDAACAEFGITHGQYNVLRILKGAYPDGYPRNEVICRMIERAPDVTRLIDRLENQGLVARERTGSDKRLSIAKITDRGLVLLDKMLPKIQALSSIVADKLSPEECEELSRICEKLYEEEK